MLAEGRSQRGHAPSHRHDDEDMMVKTWGEAVRTVFHHVTERARAASGLPRACHFLAFAAVHPNERLLLIH